MFKKLLSWIWDDWADILKNDENEALPQNLLMQNLKRVQLIAIIMVIYEPISLVLMLTGHSQTFTLWYIVPTAALIVWAALQLLYYYLVNKGTISLQKHGEAIIYCSFLFLMMCLSTLVIGDISQYGQTFLNYLLALCVGACIPIFRFKRLLALLILPFIAESAALSYYIDVGFIIEPISLFFFSLVWGTWLSHNSVKALKDNLDMQRTTEQLRISEENYRLVLNQSGKKFFMMDIFAHTILFPQSIADIIGAPTLLENVPESFSQLNIFPKDSLDSICNLCDCAASGTPSGSVLLTCRLPRDPEKVYWYSVSYSTIFDRNKLPMSALVICEDMTEQHEKELAYQRVAQLNKELTDSGSYSVEYNLDKRTIEHAEYLNLDEELSSAMKTPDDLIHYLNNDVLLPEEAERLREFVDHERLISRYQRGLSSDTAIFKARTADEEHRDCLKLTLQIVQDPYTNDKKAFFSVSRVSQAEQHALEMQRSIEKLKTELESSRIRAMINQMQPHFLYNALSAIQTIIKIDPDRAYDLIYDFTVHLRASIKALSSDKPIPFSEELRNVKAYLNIEQMRFEDSLTIKYEIDAKDFMIVPLSIQPLAENATRHGIWSSSSGSGTVVIRSFEQEDAYVIEVEDDGIGFDVEHTLKTPSNSYGLRNLQFRLKHLINADVKINSKIGEGTCVTVLIPKEQVSEEPGQDVLEAASDEASDTKAKETKKKEAAPTDAKSEEEAPKETEPEEGTPKDAKSENVDATETHTEEEAPAETKPDEEAESENVGTAEADPKEDSEKNVSKAEVKSPPPEEKDSGA